MTVDVDVGVGGQRDGSADSDSTFPGLAFRFSVTWKEPEIRESD